MQPVAGSTVSSSTTVKRESGDGQGNTSNKEVKAVHIIGMASLWRHLLSVIVSMRGNRESVYVYNNLNKAGQRLL